MSSQPLPTFRQKWVDFRRRVLDGLIHPSMMKIAKHVFYAGALAYLKMMRSAFEQGITTSDFSKYHIMVENEIQSHFEQLEADTVH